eukprot:COSAG04_NODE_4476_length_2067_cov_2.118394_4_plen_115_part_00
MQAEHRGCFGKDALAVDALLRGCRQGPPMEIEKAVHKSTRAIADLYGLADRGSIAAGQKADINVIDLQRLKVLQPEYVHDLPEDASRWVQEVEGCTSAPPASPILRISRGAVAT